MRVESEEGWGEWEDEGVGEGVLEGNIIVKYAFSSTTHLPSLPAISWTLLMKISGQPSRKRSH